jgi:hypothetical protein
MYRDAANPAAPTETLTDSMIRAFLTGAGQAGDMEACRICEMALWGEVDIDHPGAHAIDGMDQAAARSVAEMITSARAMDDSKPLVRVVA